MAGLTDALPVRWLVPPEVEPEARAEVLRLKLVLLASLSVCAVYAGMASVTADGWLTVGVYLSGVAFSGGSYLIVRTARTMRDVARVGHVVLGVNLLLVLGLTPVTGGSETWNVWFLTVFPLYAFLQLGLRAGVFWTLATLGVVVAIPSMPAWVPFEPDPYLAAIQPAAGLVFVAVIAAIGRGVLDEQVAGRQRKTDEAEANLAVRVRVVREAAATLRAPLSRMLARTGALSGRLDEGRVRSRVETVERCGRDLDRLLDDLVDSLEVEGGVSLEPQVVDAYELAAQVVELFEARARAQGLELRLEGDHGEVSVDARRVRQILSNLVGNALKFTEVGTVTVQVERSPGRLVYRVLDTGPGMEDPARLLQPFEQGQAGRRAGGTGLGLWISQALLAQMGGGLAVESALGRGTIVTATIGQPS